jgi:hypothetical protein
VATDTNVKKNFFHPIIIAVLIGRQTAVAETAMMRVNISFDAPL